MTKLQEELGLAFKFISAIPVSGDGVEEYAIEITRVLEQTGVQNLLLRVTDQRLIDQTGGIVQGMVVSYNRDNTGNP